MSHISRELDGIHTELLLQNYVDRILVLVTQIGKVGNLIQASIPAATPLLPAPKPDPSQPDVLLLPQPSAAIQLTPLFGSAPTGHIHTLHALYVSQIATIIWTTEQERPIQMPRRNVVVGIALRNTHASTDSAELNKERGIFMGVMEMLREALGKT